MMHDLMQRSARPVPAHCISAASHLHLPSRLLCSSNTAHSRSVSARPSTCVQAAGSRADPEAAVSRPRGFGTPQPAGASAPSRPRGFDTSSTKTFDPKYFNDDTPWDEETPSKDSSSPPLRGVGTNPGTRKLTVRKGTPARSGSTARPAPSKTVAAPAAPLAVPAGRSRPFGQLLQGLHADMMGVPASPPPPTATHAPATLAGRRKRVVEATDDLEQSSPTSDEDSNHSSNSTPLQQAYNNQRSTSQAAYTSEQASYGSRSRTQGSRSYQGQSSSDSDYERNAWVRDAPHRNRVSSNSSRVPFGHEESEWAPQQRQQPQERQSPSMRPRDDRPSRYNLFNLPGGEEWAGGCRKEMRGEGWAT